MGVIAECDVDYGRIYGPFPAVGHIPKSHFIGYMTSDERHESAIAKVNVNDGYLGTTWLPYVHPARTVDEQNMEAYMKDGHIYYRTLRIIRAGEELLVWYSKDFADILRIPSISNVGQQNDNNRLRCPECDDKFLYTYSLMAHRRFRCLKASTYGVNSSVITPSPSYRGHTSPENDKDILLDKSKDETSKRNASTDTPVDRKKLKVDTSVEENNNDKTVNASPQKSNNEYIDPDIGSAFKKVEKLKPVNPLIHQEQPRESVTETLVADKEHSFDTRQQTSLEYTHSFYKADQNISKYSGFGMLMPNWGVLSTNGSLPTGDQRRFTSSSVSLPVIPRGMGVLSQDAIRRYPNGEMISKHILMEQLRKSHLPMVSTSNPMVEKILQTASNPVLLKQPMQPLNLAQNWCAKCNATFRMTSDLVYHMRSHHKREFDPIKKKRDDKLQCDVCNETFKERHHLTRHMTSHM